MDVFYKQMGEEHKIRNLGQVFLYGEILYLRDKRGDDMGEINLSKCDNFTIVDNEPETEEENETEPKHAHWIDHPHEAGPCWEYSLYECSECHEWAEIGSDYCPNCGAEMEEE